MLGLVSPLFQGGGVLRGEIASLAACQPTVPQPGLVSADIRAKQVANAAASEVTQRALAASRDTARAARARIEKGLPMSSAAAAERDRRVATAGRRQRTGRVTTCEGCGVEFCAMVGSARRRYCCRACASRTTRARTRTRDAATEPPVEPLVRALTRRRQRAPWRIA